VSELIQRRRQYSREFKQEAVALVEQKNYTIAEAARSLGIRANNLSRWRQEYLQLKQNAFPGSGHEPGGEDELSRLREENRRLKMEREILKKAAAFFARESG
jgi:transposase